MIPTGIALTLISFGAALWGVYKGDEVLVVEGMMYLVATTVFTAILILTAS